MSYIESELKRFDELSKSLTQKLNMDPVKQLSFQEKLGAYKEGVRSVKVLKTIIQECKEELKNFKKPNEALTKSIREREHVVLKDHELRIGIFKDRLGKDKELQSKVKELEEKYGQLVNDPDTREMLHLEKELVYEQSMNRDLQTAIRNMVEANELQSDMNDILQQDMERLRRVYATDQEISTTLIRTNQDIKTVVNQEDQKVFWMFCIALGLGALDVLVIMFKFGN